MDYETRCILTRVAEYEYVRILDVDERSSTFFLGIGREADKS
jgi:hypothetical protein